MPEAGYIHSASLMINAIDDPIVANDNLANGWIIEFRDDTPHLWKVSQSFDGADQKPSENYGAFR